MSDYILKTENLSLSYGGFMAVDNVSLNVGNKTIHSVIGPNGAGKTSLFHCLTGGRRPTGGQIMFNGADITNKSPDARVSCGMTRSFQITSLFQNLSVRENLRLASQGRDGSGALVFWRSLQSDRKHFEMADSIMERLGLSQRANAAAGDLEVMRVALDADELAAFHDGTHACGAAAHEGVEHRGARRDDARQLAHQCGGLAGHVVLVVLKHREAIGAGERAVMFGNCAAACGAPDDVFALVLEVALVGRAGA